MKRLICFLICIIAALLFSYRTLAANESSKAAKVITESTALNVRQRASSSSEILTKLKKGSWVTVLSESGSFYKVEYSSGNSGYCHKDYLKIRAKSKALYVSVNGSLNIRSGAGTSYSVKGTLKNGDCVVYLSESGQWTRVLYNGTKKGYVYSSYLKEEKPVYAYKKIALSVPSYKQTDSRWSSVKIGTSGDTIGSSGCTTTALAMTESFRLKKEITPSAMASRLVYAPAGWLYWPENYRTVQIYSSESLSQIYSLLSKGIPVIIGAKNSRGSQHWVTVTGHISAENTLSAKNFSINDPGSTRRTTLAQFLSDFPNYYKLAYYS